jgi:histone H3/H4
LYLRNTFILSGVPFPSWVFVMASLPVAPVERMIKEAGAERVSGTAAKALAGVLEDHGTEIATKAIKLAKHAGRKTVKAQDIGLAVR